MAKAEVIAPDRKLSLGASAPSIPAPPDALAMEEPENEAMQQNRPPVSSGSSASCRTGPGSDTSLLRDDSVAIPSRAWSPLSSIPSAELSDEDPNKPDQGDLVAPSLAQQQNTLISEPAVVHSNGLNAASANLRTPSNNPDGQKRIPSSSKKSSSKVPKNGSVNNLMARYLSNRSSSDKDSTTPVIVAPVEQNHIDVPPPTPGDFIVPPLPGQTVPRYRIPKKSALIPKDQQGSSPLSGSDPLQMSSYETAASRASLIGDRQGSDPIGFETFHSSIDTAHVSPPTIPLIDASRAEEASSPNAKWPVVVPQRQAAKEAEKRIHSQYKKDPRWEWNDLDQQMSSVKAESLDEPDIPTPPVRVGPNPIRRAFCAKRQLEEDASKLLSQPQKKAKAIVELPQVEEPRTVPTWSEWVPYPPMRNLVKARIASTRRTMSERWTHGFIKLGKSARPSGRKSATNVDRPLPHAPPSIWFDSWVSLLESPAYGKTRSGTKLGSRDLAGYSATALVLEGRTGPDSSWAGKTLTITVRRRLQFEQQTKRNSKKKGRRSLPSVVRMKARLNIDQAGLLNTWYSKHSVDLLVKSDFDLLPFHLEKTYALLGSYTIKNVFMAKDADPIKETALKFVFEWDEGTNSRPPWWMTPEITGDEPCPPLTPDHDNGMFTGIMIARESHALLEPAVVSAEQNAQHSADMASVLFGTSKSWHCASDWLNPTKGGVFNTTIDITRGGYILEAASIYDNTVDIGSLTWQPNSVHLREQTFPAPDYILQRFLGDPLPMVRGFIPNTSFIYRDDVPAWFCYRATWNELYANECGVQAWGSTPSAAVDAMNLLNRMAVLDHSPRLFYTLTTVLGSSGRECKFLLRAGDQVALLALRSPVLIRFDLKNPPKKPKTPRKSAVKKVIVMTKSGKFVQKIVHNEDIASVEPSVREVKVAPVEVTNSAEEIQTEPNDSTVDVGIETLQQTETELMPTSGSHPITSSTPKRIKRTNKGKKSLKTEKNVSGMGKPKKSKSSIVKSGPKSKIVGPTTKVKGAIKTKTKAKRQTPRKAPKAANGPKVKRPQMALEHGQSAIISTSVDLIIWLQWDQCGFVCIGSHDDPPPGARELALAPDEEPVNPPRKEAASGEVDNQRACSNEMDASLHGVHVESKDSEGFDMDISDTESDLPLMQAVSKAMTGIFKLSGQSIHPDNSMIVSLQDQDSVITPTMQELELRQVVVQEMKGMIAEPQMSRIVQADNLKRASESSINRFFATVLNDATPELMREPSSDHGLMLPPTAFAPSQLNGYRPILRLSQNADEDGGRGLTYVPQEDHAMYDDDPIEETNDDPIEESDEDAEGETDHDAEGETDHDAEGETDHDAEGETDDDAQGDNGKNEFPNASHLSDERVQGQRSTVPNFDDEQYDPNRRTVSPVSQYLHEPFPSGSSSVSGPSYLPVEPSYAPGYLPVSNQNGYYAYPSYPYESIPQNFHQIGLSFPSEQRYTTHLDHVVHLTEPEDAFPPHEASDYW
ncbi:hypothetical protein DACRYDRAFT_115156 [Dacryopinax primogenitus]|uniref:Uncharacterized protein n=1 Tax=Dacryopinax primogenitus (strain DJM 731) TaxID=1858805 RepID=M5G6L2_DACPD|nr:uncharacterized protein DACRYDRAFT_115156 [Dacryopinax primogenitus]EJU03845.1 hypothetical protein DACRYDRAFT_115156 [Dacryopinax primogenitus]